MPVTFTDPDTGRLIQVMTMEEAYPIIRTPENFYAAPRGNGPKRKWVRISNFTFDIDSIEFREADDRGRGADCIRHITVKSKDLPEDWRAAVPSRSLVNSRSFLYFLRRHGNFMCWWRGSRNEFERAFGMASEEEFRRRSGKPEVHMGEG